MSRWPAVCLLLSSLVSIVCSLVPPEPRQDPNFSITSSSSYNYWWPYPPGGIYTTTSINPYQEAALTTPSSTTIWYTPPTPTPLSLALPTDYPTPFPSSPTSSIDPTSSVSPWSNTISTTTASTGTSFTRSPSTTSQTTTSSAIPGNDHRPTNTSEKAIYLAAIVALVGISAGLGIAILIYRRRMSDNSSAFGQMGRYEEGHNGEKDSKYRDDVYWRRGLARLLGSKAPPMTNANRLPPAPPACFFEEDDDMEVKATYGYGEWRDRSLQRHIDLNLVRADSKEGDAEEIDLSKGWKHFSSLYQPSPKGSPRSGQSSEDKFTAIPSTRRGATTPASTPAKASATPKSTKYSSLLRLPFIGRPKASPTNRSSIPSTPTTVTGYGASASDGLRRTSAGKKKRLEQHDDELSLTSRPYESPQFLNALSPYGSDEEDGNLDDPLVGGTNRIHTRKHQSILRKVLADQRESLYRQPFLSADQMSLNDVPPTPQPLHVRDRPVSTSVSEIVRGYDEGRQKKEELGDTSSSDEGEEDIGITEVEEMYKRSSAIQSKGRLTTQALKTDDGPSSSSAAFMNRAHTFASTVPSIYSPSPSSGPSPADAHTKTFKHYLHSRRSTLYSTDAIQETDSPSLISAADMAKASKRKPARPPPQRSALSFVHDRAQSPLPDLPSGIMSPPLEADFFFGAASPPPARASRPSQASPATPKQIRSTLQPTTQSRQTPSRSSTRTTARSITPPPSHFTSGARESANTRVDAIVKHGYEAGGEGSGRPISPTGFGAYSNMGGSESFSPVPAEIEDSYEGGIEQRLALLRRAR